MLSAQFGPQGESTGQPPASTSIRRDSDTPFAQDRLPAQPLSLPAINSPVFLSMPWLQLILECSADDAALYSDLLSEQGAAAVTMVDSADQPLFEPAVGTTPL